MVVLVFVAWSCQAQEVILFEVALAARVDLAMMKQAVWIPGTKFVRHLAWGVAEPTPK